MASLVAKTAQLQPAALRTHGKGLVRSARVQRRAPIARGANRPLWLPDTIPPPVSGPPVGSRFAWRMGARTHKAIDIDFGWCA